MSHGPRAVWITGVGAATPMGFSYREVADALLAGRPAVRALPNIESPDQVCRIAASLGPIPTPPSLDRDEFAALGSWEQLLAWPAEQALRDSGHWDRRESLRIGLVIGIGSAWLPAWEADMHRGGHRIADPKRDHTTLPRWLAHHLGLRGPVSTVAAACASGNIAMGQARTWVSRGWVDVCLAGAVDRSITPMGMAGFGNLGALARRQDDPASASRPFDRARDGFVMGEGGGLFVLEPEKSARVRGAHAYAQIAGFGASSDAYHLVIPSSDPTWCIQAMNKALSDANLNPASIDYLNAHATSTPVGDRFEARAIREVLGPAVGRVPVSATKGMTGHLLGASSAIEAIACLAALERNAIPPTINLDDPDPECDLFHVPHAAIERRVDTAMSNSFGFGGSNTCLVVRRVA
jgi:3-oxoacyl-[acyl-carrier-protein] synthase II